MQVSGQRSEVRGQNSERPCTLTAPFHAALDFLIAHHASHAPHLAVAVSGGADSLALTLLAADWAQAHGGRITALTVDHGLRPESAAEAAQVAAWLRARGIAHHTLTPAHVPVSGNLQQTARQWRYDALADFCAQHGILHCLLAHHAGDQRETVALHEARGSTADGPSGMAACRNYRGVRFLRPLLTAEKSMLVDYLTAQHQPWVEDPSNQNTDFARVRLRATLRENPAETARLRTLQHTAAQDRHERDIALAKAALACATLHPLGFATLDAQPWHALPEPLRSQLLADVLTTISGRTQRPRAHETARLATALAADGKHTLHGCEIRRQGTRITLAREAARVAAPLTLSGHGTQMWDGRFRIHHHLPEGCSLTLRALGAAGRKQLGDKTLPLASPSLWHLDELVHVPHMAWHHPHWPKGATVVLGFAPPKPLAAASIWWLNQDS